MEELSYQKAVDIWKKKRNTEEAPPSKPRNIQYLLDDTTMEAMVERLEDNPRGLFWPVDEFSGFFQSLDRYSRNGSGGEGKKKLIGTWESASISATRKSQNGISNEMFVPQATVGIYGSIQPHLFSQLFSAQDLAQGLPQRFLFVRSVQLAPQMIPYPPMDGKVRDIIDRISERLLSIGMVTDENGVARTTFINMEQEAKSVFSDSYAAMSSETFNTPMYSFAQKMARMTLRLAVVLHYLKLAASDEPVFADEKKPVDGQTMRDAIRIAEWFYAHTRYIQGMLPDSGGERIPGELKPIETRVADMILSREKEISECGGMVPNSLWKEWLAAAGISLGRKETAECMKALRMRAWHDRNGRGKEITAKTLAWCRKAAAPMKDMFGGGDEED